MEKLEWNEQNKGPAPTLTTKSHGASISNDASDGEYEEPERASVPGKPPRQDSNEPKEKERKAQ